MANCKICNTTIPDGMEICDDCMEKTNLNNELYLDQLLASVIGNQTQSHEEDHITEEETMKPELSKEEILDPVEEETSYSMEIDTPYTVEEETPYAEEDDNFNLEDEIIRNSSKDDDWILLNQTIQKSAEENKDHVLNDNDIPDEGALDEVESILDDYDAVLQEIANGGDYFQESDVNETKEEQPIYLENLVPEDFMDPQEDIMHISNDFVEEEMENPLIDQDVLQAMDADILDLYENDASINSISLDENLVNEPEYIEESMEPNEPEYMEESEEPMEPEYMEESEEPVEPEYSNESIEPEKSEQPVQNGEIDLSSILGPQENFTPIELSDEMTELDRLLGEVTENADDYKLRNIMSMDVIKEEPEQDNPKTTNTSDIFSKSLSAVSDLADDDLESRFNDILPTETKKEEKKKPSLLKRVFGNIPPENPEEELKKLAEEEELEKEKKKQKEEEHQKKKEDKKAKKEEKKAKKVAAAEDKRKKQAEENEKKRKAREAIAAAYVPEGKLNKVGVMVVFVMAACLAFVIIKGTDVASYKLTIKSAEKDFKHSRFDQAYESLSGRQLKEKDTAVYDKLQTVMIVKKQLNSYYHFKEINMPLEALDSVLKGIDRYERYYAEAKELEVDKELDSLKKKLLTILKKEYALSEKEALKLIAIENGQTYTDKLTAIVKATSPKDTEQVVQK